MLTLTRRLRQEVHDPRYLVIAAFALSDGESAFLVRTLGFLPETNSFLFAENSKETTEESSITESLVQGPPPSCEGFCRLVYVVAAGLESVCSANFANLYLR
jgi:hypothetical protein